MYIAHTETGLLQAGTIDPELTDGDVYQALTDLMMQLQDPATFEKFFAGKTDEKPNKLDLGDSENEHGFVQSFVLMNLRDAFAKFGRLPAEDVIGILDVIKTSVKRWSVGMHRRGYLTYIEEFLGQMGVYAKRLTQEEVENLEFYRATGELEAGEQNDE